MPYRVLLVEEGNTLKAGASLLYQSGELASCGTECTPSELPRAVQTYQPDLILMLMTGNELLPVVETVMAERPTPIVLLEASADLKEAVFRAMALGALEAFVLPEKPTLEFWFELSRKLPLLAQVRVVRHVRGNLKRRGKPRPQPNEEPGLPLVAIASSLGGPKALSVLLRGLPRELPAALVLCQHISDGFTAGLASWLSTEARLPVVEAMDGQVLQPGMAYLARSGFHLVVRADGTLHLDEAPPMMGFRPSCDVLLSSAAEAFHTRCTGVILTGMGRDGARGLLEIRRHGGHTIAQDEASCVVYGMPREAVALGAVQEQLPLEKIAQAIVERVKG